MAKKKSFEFRENKQYNRNNEGLKQRRLKDEARWKFNPSSDYTSDEFVAEEEDEMFYDPSWDDHR